MIVAGIDPGISGAIAIIDTAGGEILLADDLPLLKTQKGNNELNIPEIAATLRGYRIGEVKLEQVHAMPKQGVTSSFNFGRSYGALQAIVQTIGIPITLVTPQAWKKAAGILRTDKDYARTRALQLYPDADLARKKDIGKADAILIARFG